MIEENSTVRFNNSNAFINIRYFYKKSPLLLNSNTFFIVNNAIDFI